MPLYESVVIARQDISPAQVETLADELTEILKENGSSVPKRELWGLRSLAYRMKKNRKGHYVLFNIEGPGDAIAEYERRMRINEDVLRFMTVRVEEHEEGPSVMMQSRGDRDRGDRGDRGPRGDRGDRGDRPRREEAKSDDAPKSEGDS